MPDASTPAMGLIKPEVGASRSTWGTKWNANADEIDATCHNLNNAVVALQSQVATLQSQMTTALQSGAPIGAIFPWTMYSSLPNGYAYCDGTVLPIADHPTLYGIIGTAYGGDGVTTFRLPDMRGCVLAGNDGGTGRLGGQVTPDVPGAVGGAPFIAISEAQMPPHFHPGHTDAQGEHSHHFNSPTLPAGSGFAIGSGAQFIFADALTGSTGLHTHNFNTDSAGGGAGHPNLQVTMIVVWIIRTI